MRRLIVGGIGAVSAAAAVVAGLATTGGTAAATQTHTGQTWHGRAVAETSAAAAPQSAAAATDEDKGKTIRFVAHETNFTFFDLGNDDFGPGDYFVFRERDKSGSNTVGHNTIVCHVNFGDVVDCTGTIVLAKGQITAIGEVPDTNRFTLPVVGGTGAYRDATGQVKLHNLNDSDTDYEVQLDS
jgi:hypothetical protein